MDDSESASDRAGTIFGESFTKDAAAKKLVPCEFDSSLPSVRMTQRHKTKRGSSVFAGRNSLRVFC